MLPEPDWPNVIRRRALGYFLLTVVLAGFIVLLPKLGFAGGTGFDPLIENAAGLCALVAGISLLYKAHGMRDPTFALVLGAALVCSGLFATGQLLLWQTPLQHRLFSPIDAVAPWYWTIERISFGVLLVAALLARQRARILGPDNGVTPRLVVFGAVGMTIPVLLYFLTSPVPRIEFHFTPFRRPIEIVPLALLLGVTFQIVRRGDWRREALEHWLLIALLLHLAGEILVLVHGGRTGSADLSIAQFFRLAGHLCALIGVIAATPLIGTGRASPRVAPPPTGLFRFGFRGIGLRLLLIFGAMIAGVVMLTALNGYWVEREALLQAKRLHLSSIAEAQKSAIENMLAQYRNEAALVTSRTHLRSLLNRINQPERPAVERQRNLAQIELVLEDALAVMPRSPGMAVFDNHGRKVVGVGKWEPEQHGVDPKHVVQVPWLLDLRYGDGGAILISTSPITFKQRRIGTLLLALSPQELFAQLQSNVGLGDSTETILGRIGDWGGVELISPLGYLPPNADMPFRLPLKSATLMARAITGIEDLSDVPMIDYRDEPIIAVTRRIQSVDWGLLVKIDEEEIELGITALGRTHLKNGAAVLMFALVVAYVMITVFLAPLQRLVRYTEKIRDGQYNFRLRNLADDEIGQLGRTLNNMAESIELRTGELEEKTLRIETIVDSMVDGLIVIDSTGTIESVNRSVPRLFGYERHELVGENVRILMPEPYRSRHDRYLSRYLETGERRILGSIREMTAERRDGSLFPVELSVAEIRIGDQTRFTGIVRDITERIAAEQKLSEQNITLKQANEDLEQFAYIASHDLRTPLRAVDNLVQWIEEDLGDDLAEETATNMVRMKERVRRMERMIQDLLQYSRAGRRHIIPEQVDCNELVQGIILDLSPPAGMVIEALTLPILTTPRAALETVLRNLIANAIKHHDQEQGLIQVSAHDDRGYIEFNINDDGPGIPRRFHGKIFQIFQSLASKKDGDGTGMGLALVKRLVHAGGGRIEVYSSDDARGTRFSFLWPKEWPHHADENDDPKFGKKEVQ